MITSHWLWPAAELPERRLASRKVVESVLTAPAAEDERATITHNPTLPTDVVALLSTDPDTEVRRRIAHHPRLPQDRRRALGTDTDAGVRESIAYRSDLEPDELRALTADPDPRVRLAASMDLALTDTEREAIDYEVPTDDPFVPWPQPRVPRDPAELRRNALSGHPMLRRKAARDRFLPPDLVERLATDDDLGVRVLLAQNHPEAPADLLPRSFLEYTGPQREQLVIRPDFPTAGLAHYADHEDPAVRALAARDPATSAQTVERLTHDPDPRVRAASAPHRMDRRHGRDRARHRPRGEGGEALPVVRAAVNPALREPSRVHVRTDTGTFPRPWRPASRSTSEGTGHPAGHRPFGVLTYRTFR